MNNIQPLFRYPGRYLALGFGCLLALVFAGFFHSYFGVSWQHFGSISGFVHLHAGLGLLWVLLLIAQSVLIETGRQSLHRRMGKISYVLFPVFLLSVLPLVFYTWLRGDQLTLFAAAGDAFLLLVFYVLAMKSRRKPAVHQRYILATGLVLLDPVLGRLAGNTLHLSPDWVNYLPFIAMDATVFVLLFYDWIKRQQLKPWLIVATCFLTYQTTAIWLKIQQPVLAMNSTSMDLSKIEHSEIAAWQDLFAARPITWYQEQGCEEGLVDSVSLFICRKIPFPHFNLALDAGVNQPLTETALDHILTWFRERQVNKFYLQVTPVTQPEGVADWLITRGLRHVSSWHRIARRNQPLGESIPLKEEYTVEIVDRSNAAAWAAFIDSIYGMPTGKWLLELPGRPGWHQVICRQNGKIIAARSMKINADGTAYFCIDAPVPGIMTQHFEADYVLTRKLIEIGLSNGVELFTADIEKPSPAHDTPAYTYWSNLGFEVAYEKRNFMY